MANNTGKNEVAGDPLAVEGEAPWVVIPTLVVRILGMATLAAYSAWFLSHLWGNQATVSGAESSALETLAAIISGAAPAIAAMTGLEILGWVVVCILSALFLVFVWNGWRKKIVREWKWVWRQLTSGSWWDKLFGIFGFVLTLIETVFGVLVTVVTVVMVYINLRVLIPILP